MGQVEVVITGLGVVTPCGIGVDEMWNALLTGRSGIDWLSAARNTDLPVKIGGEIRSFPPGEFITPRKRLKLMCREMQIGYAAANLAADNAGLVRSCIDPDRVGVVFGGEIYYGPIEDTAEAYRVCLVDGKMEPAMWGEAACRELNPLYMLQTLPNMCACHIAIGHDARGPCNTIVSGDISSLLAIIEAVRLIQRGAADVVIAGGSGSRVNMLRMVKHDYAGLSHQASNPQTASRPFDARREGAVLGEGAGALVLESRLHARRRNATVLARLLGYHGSFQKGNSANGHGLDGIRRSMVKAMEMASLGPQDIGHVNAHASSMVDPDRIEAQAIRQCLGNTPVTAPKSYFGSLGAGSGAVELAISVMAVSKGIVPPTLNYEHADPTCPVNVIQAEPRKTRERTAIKLNQTPFGQFVSVLIAAEEP